jgi:hypothetical protein
MSMHRTGWLVMSLLLTGGCAKMIDGFLVKGPIAQTLTLTDVDLACRSANANVPTALGVSQRNPPRRALVILGATSALCSEFNAMEAELLAERSWFSLSGDARVAEVTDAREREKRHRAVTAVRLERAFADLEARFGPVGEGCPKLKNTEDELTYVLGLVGGAAGLLQDQASGGSVGVTTDRLGKIARAAACLDDDVWWHVPAALRAGSWAMVPGSGPAGTDPWQALSDAAAAGDRSGMRLARAIQVQVAANAGRTDDVKAGIRAFGKVTTSPDHAFRLLDVHASVLVRHQADLIWVKARGHRAPGIGPLPDDSRAAAPSIDPFGADPFGADPFADGPPAELRPAP